MVCNLCGSRAIKNLRRQTITIKKGKPIKTLERARYCGKCHNMLWGNIKQV